MDNIKSFFVNKNLPTSFRYSTLIFEASKLLLLLFKAVFNWVSKERHLLWFKFGCGVLSKWLVWFWSHDTQSTTTLADTAATNRHVITLTFRWLHRQSPAYVVTCSKIHVVLFVEDALQVNYFSILDFKQCSHSTCWRQVDRKKGSEEDLEVEYVFWCQLLTTFSLK